MRNVFAVINRVAGETVLHLQVIDECSGRENTINNHKIASSCVCAGTPPAVLLFVRPRVSVLSFVFTVSTPVASLFGPLVRVHLLHALAELRQGRESAPFIARN
jgi:hypothetical protein